MEIDIAKAFRNDVPKDDIDPQLIFEDNDLSNDQLFRKYVPRIFPPKIGKEIMGMYPDLRCRKHDELFKFKDRSMILLGKPGTGKSFAACMLALFSNRKKKKINWYYLSYTVIFVTVPDMLAKIRNLAIHGNKELIETGRTAYDQYIYELKMCRFLILDDLGTEKQTDFADAALDSIINNRYEAGWRHTIITTNLSIKDLDANKGHARILSRINDIGEILVMNHGYRKKEIVIKRLG